MNNIQNIKWNKMYKKSKAIKTTIAKNISYEGERIEEKVNRVTNNKEPITDGAPLIYTERSKGVEAQYDIRTDRFEVAIEAMDKVSKSVRAKREVKPNLGKEAKEGMKLEGEGGTQSIQATDN